MRRAFVSVALCALFPIYGGAWRDVPGLTIPRKMGDGPLQGFVQIAEGSLTKVDPEMRLIWVQTPDGNGMEFRYNEQTQVEAADENVVGCFGSKSETQVRIHFRAVGGSRTAGKIEVLPQPSLGP